MDWHDLRPEPEDTLNEPVDQAIRHALWQEIGRAEPPDRVWRRISAQIAAGPSRRRRRATSAPGSFLAPLAQGVAAMVLVLLLGLNMLPYIVMEHPVTTEEATPLPLDVPVDAPAQLDAANPAPADGIVENIDTLKARLRQQQRQLEAQPQAEPGRAYPDSNQGLASSQTRARKNPTAAVQPDEDNYWSPPRPRPPAPTRAHPQAPRF